MFGSARRIGPAPRIPLPAIAGLITGLAVGLVACVTLQIRGGNSEPPAAVIANPASRPEPEAELALAAPSPPQLAGLKGAAVRRTFGEPEMRRREPPAEVWQYRSARCVLDLYFYGDPDGEGVVHYEYRARDPRQDRNAAASDDCIAEIAGRKRPVV